MLTHVTTPVFVLPVSGHARGEKQHATRQTQGQVRGLNRSCTEPAFQMFSSWRIFFTKPDEDA